MAITRLRNRKKNSSVNNNKDAYAQLNSTVPQDLFTDRHYQSVSFLPNTDYMTTTQVGFTDQNFWVTNGGKQIVSCGDARSSLGGSRGVNADIPEPMPCQLKPQLDTDDFIVDYAPGLYYCVFVTNKGYVYSGGNNDNGNLGHNDTTTIPYFRRVTSTAGGVLFGPGGEKAIRCYTNVDIGGTANRTTYILTANRQLWGTGYNGNYNLGITGDTTQRNAFVRVAPTVNDIKDVYVGKYTVGVVLYNGQLYTWGFNGNGEQGLGNTTTQQTAVLSASNVSLVRHCWSAVGTRFCFHLKTDGTVWFSGYQSSNGQAGLGNLTDYTSWQQVTNAFINNSNNRVVDIRISGWTGDANPYATTYFLMDNGAIYSCGYNGYGQMGWNGTTGSSSLGAVIQPNGFPKVDQIAVFGNYSVNFLYGINKESGRMFAVGSWNYGAIGYGFGDWAANTGVGRWDNRTATSFRACWPAREVDAPPVIQDGLAKFHSVVSTNSNNSANGQQPNPFILCTDGTLWTLGNNYSSYLGTPALHGISADISVIRDETYNSTWKLVKF